VAEKGNMLDKSGNLPNIDRPFLVDAGGTVVGSFLSLPVITTYVESASGVESGRRTGLTSVTTGIMFLIMLLITSLIILLPTEATGSALILFATTMLSDYNNINFDDTTNSLPAIITSEVKIFTFIFGNGIAACIITYLFIKALYSRYKNIHPGLYILVIPLIL